MPQDMRRVGGCDALIAWLGEWPRITRGRQGWGRGELFRGAGDGREQRALPDGFRQRGDTQLPQQLDEGGWESIAVGCDEDEGVLR